MIYALLLSIAGNVLLAVCVIWLARLALSYVTERDDREQKERETLLQRIQAPEVAVAQAAAPARSDQQWISPDDDHAFLTYAQERSE